MYGSICVVTGVLVVIGVSADAGQPAVPSFGAPVLVAGDEHLGALDIGDFDGDGLPDVAAVTVSGQVSVYRNTDGTLSHFTHLPLNAIPFVLEVRVAELNGDNLPDMIAIGGGAMNHQLYFQQSNGSFNVVDSGIPGAFYFPNFDVEDMDGDRDIDLVTINPFAVHLNDGMGNFTTQGQSQQQPIFDIARIGQLNGDGQPDFLRIDSVPGTVESMMNAGGALTAIATHPIEHDFQFAFGDFNNDNLLDVASLRFDQPSGATVLVLLSAGNGAFTGPVISQFATAPRALFIGDVNRDGTQDIVGPLEGAGSLMFMIGAGDGTFFDAGRYDGVPTQSDPFVESIFDLIVTDVDGDQDNDLIVAAWQHGLVVIPNESPIDRPTDVNEDGAVNVFDLLAVLDAWGSCAGCVEDVDNSGAVDVFDLLLVLNEWD